MVRIIFRMLFLIADCNWNIENKQINHNVNVFFPFLIFNNIGTTEDSAPHWLEVLIIPFLKPKKSGSLCQVYHAIASTSCLCKLL